MKMSEIDLPADSSMAASVSCSVVFAVACHARRPHTSGDVGQVCRVVASGLGDAVAAKLLDTGLGQHERHHGLSDDPGCGHRAHVGALVDSRCRIGARDVDSAQGARDRADRLHGGAHPQDLAGGHAAFGATGTSGDPLDRAVWGALHLVVGSRAATGSRREAVPDLDTLDRLNAHERTSEAGIEAAVPVHVRAQAGWQAIGQDLNDSSQGVAVILGRIDLGDHLQGAALIERAHGVGIQGLDVVGRRQGRGVAHVGLADGDRMRHQPDAVGLAEELRRDLSEGGHRVGAHHGLPLGPFGVGDVDRDGSAQGASVAHAAEEGHLVLLELHPRPTAIAETTTSQGGAEIRRRHLDACRKALQDGNECRSVRFTKSCQSE